MHNAKPGPRAMLLQPAGAGPQARLLDIDAQIFRGCFDRKPFAIGHGLTNHPLFEIPRLMELARSLPERNVEYNAGNIPLSVAPERTPRNGLSAEETILRIAECQSWMVLRCVEHDPEYRALLQRCLAEVAPHSELLYPGMFLEQGFIILSSPGSVTPYHMDPEHNFLLQIRGSKRVDSFDGHDRSILSDEELEQFYRTNHRNLEYKNRGRAWTFDLVPGRGMHLPVTAPHYVLNGPQVSISFSITFRTPDLKRRRMVHLCNAFLRQCGLRPTPAGTRPWQDFLKFAGFGSVQRTLRLFRGVRGSVTSAASALVSSQRQARD